MLKKPVNENYCANVVSIKSVIELDGMKTIAHTNIYGNMVIVSKELKIGDVGIFFPIETKLSNDFLHYNNLYRHNNLNLDQTKKGFFEDNGRVRCVKFQGYKSMGFFIPLDSLEFTYHRESLKEEDIFDELSGIKICEKYIVKADRVPGMGGNKGKGKLARISKLIENQFRFHQDTAQLGKNMHMLKPDDVISITKKMHGTSTISSYILCKKKLNPIEKFLKFVGVNVVDTEYDNIYASRKVVKNSDLNPSKQDYYSQDIWGIANTELKPFLAKGMTFYAEIVGYLSDNSMIQKHFDYGCEAGTHAIYIYRITYTNPDGLVYEFSAKQVQDFCTQNGLNPVPELYYGRVKDLVDYKDSEELLTFLQDTYLEKDCDMCKSKPSIPAEGVVVRIEANDLNVYKLKSFRFYEQESKEADSGEANIEDSEGDN
jgi:hypothetical protein